MQRKKILVVEDENDIRELIHFNLLKASFDVVLAEDGKVALEMFESESPDLILLDLMIPNISGIEVCKHIRSSSKGERVPIIMVTAKGGEDDIVKGLESGANDYVTKPFSPKVLIARVNAALRHTEVENDDLLKIHNISIDNKKRRFLLDGKELSLTFSEFELIYTLAQKPGWVFTRGQLVDLVRGEKHAITDRSVDVHIVGLRKKLGESAAIIESVRGVGYRMKEEG